MINKESDLPVTPQFELLKLNRSTVYYQPRPVSMEDQKLMRHIDEMYLKRPFYGSRRMRDWLQDEGAAVNRKRVQCLMRQIGLGGIYPRKRTSKPGKRRKIYPYLLAQPDHRSSQPGVGDGSDLYPDGKGLCLSGCLHGLVQPESAVLAGIHYDGSWALCRGAGRSP